VRTNGEETAVDRPDWSALSAMIDDVKRAWGGINEVQQRMMSVTGTAWSDDRMIKAVVGPRGHLLELEIDPRVYRKPNSKALAADIVATVRQAVEDVGRQTKEILDGTLPSDLRADQVGGVALGKLMTSHDADVVSKGDGGDK
jgi:DNA-binding protein YbaB